MKYRSRTDIVATILDCAQGGVTKTKIMYSAYLSYAQLKEYLSVLLEKQLLEHDSTTQTYKTTETGMRFLKTYNHMDELMDVARQA
jgi:predicted transcriptional regulator